MVRFHDLIVCFGPCCFCLNPDDDSIWNDCCCTNGNTFNQSWFLGRVQDKSRVLAKHISWENCMSFTSHLCLWMLTFKMTWHLNIFYGSFRWIGLIIWIFKLCGYVRSACNCIMNSFTLLFWIFFTRPKLDTWCVMFFAFKSQVESEVELKVFSWF